jgi:hypothetical protein
MNIKQEEFDRALFATLRKNELHMGKNAEKPQGTAMMEILLKAGANPNGLIVTGSKTIFWFFINDIWGYRDNALKILELFLKYGASLEPNDLGQTPIQRIEYKLDIEEKEIRDIMDFEKPFLPIMKARAEMYRDAIKMMKESLT